MKHIFLNLKRFDIPKNLGGVNGLAPIRTWGSYIVQHTQRQLRQYEEEHVDFVMFFPEAHLIPAIEALEEDSLIKIGCQGVHREDTSENGNFGAFTTCRTANAVKAMGCEAALIGHCEERRDKAGMLEEAGATGSRVVNRLLNQEVLAAIKAGLSVVYCIGEQEKERPEWKKVLKEQLEAGLRGADTSKIVIAYEPVWAIGPGKTPPDRETIARIGDYIKEVTGGIEVVYGGGLKKENARMIASIPSIDGGLIALTRFTGDIGFFPEEYLEIISTYIGR